MAARGSCSSRRDQRPVEQSVGGYECTFVSEVPDALTCIICLLPARNPHQISCCGRVFCKVCLDRQMVSSKSTCPNCRQKGGRGFRDIRGERSILSCKVKCSNSDRGCSWIGELSAIEEHVKRCSSEMIPCPYAAVGCDTRLFKTQLPEHKASVDHLEMAVKKIAQLSSQLKPPINLPPVVFKMEDYYYYQGNDMVWESPPFYSHPKGYKFKLQIYANGAGACHYTHMSIYVCLMSGEHDDHLIWPFRGTICFEVLNQCQDSHHNQGSARFSEKQCSIRNSRVLPGERREVGWGEVNMLRLHNDDDSECEGLDSVMDFVINGCLYVRVSQIHVSDFNKPWLH